MDEKTRGILRRADPVPGHDDHPHAGTEHRRRLAVRLPPLRRLLVRLQRRRQDDDRQHIPDRCHGPWCDHILREPRSVHCQKRERMGGRGEGHSPASSDEEIAAPILILAAGTMGTNELLLKAQALGLPSRESSEPDFRPTAMTSCSRANWRHPPTPSRPASRHVPRAARRPSARTASAYRSQRR